MIAPLSAGLVPYDWVINSVLVFVDGLLFGLAVKKGLTSFVLLIAAVLLAGYAELSIPFLNPSVIFQHLIDILTSTLSHLGPVLVAFPIVFFIGFAIGIWKG
jgi:ABC-type proline/glycine betaine transport system permease subunit